MVFGEDVAAFVVMVEGLVHFAGQVQLLLSNKTPQPESDSLLSQAAIPPSLKPDR